LYLQSVSQTELGRAIDESLNKSALNNNK
jgi:hypothetical protein